MHGERRSVEGREYQNERDMTDVDDFKSGKIWSAFLDKLLVCSAKGNSTASPRNLKLNCCRRSLQSKFDLSNQLIRRLYTAVIATAMEHICTRCARLSLRTRYQSPSMVRIANSKTFSTSSIARNDKDDGNEPTQGHYYSSLSFPYLVRLSRYCSSLWASTPSSPRSSGTAGA